MLFDMPYVLWNIYAFISFITFCIVSKNSCFCPDILSSPVFLVQLEVGVPEACLDCSL